MRPPAVVIAVAAVVLTCGACAGSGSPGDASPTPSTTPASPSPATSPSTDSSSGPSSDSSSGEPTPAGAEDRRAVRRLFVAYQEALLTRNFPRACAVTAPDAVDALIQAAGDAGVDSCEKALGALYARPAVARPLDAAARTAEIDDIVVDADLATVSYTSTLDGQARQGSTRMVRIDDTWLVVG